MPWVVAVTNKKYESGGRVGGHTLKEEGWGIDRFVSANHLDGCGRLCSGSPRFAKRNVGEGEEGSGINEGCTTAGSDKTANSDR